MKIAQNMIIFNSVYFWPEMAFSDEMPNQEKLIY